MLISKLIQMNPYKFNATENALKSKLQGSLLIMELNLIISKPALKSHFKG
jgi:hypothetical protein